MNPEHNNFLLPIVMYQFIIIFNIQHQNPNLKCEGIMERGRREVQGKREGRIIRFRLGVRKNIIFLI